MKFEQVFCFSARQQSVVMKRWLSRALSFFLGLSLVLLSNSLAPFSAVADETSLYLSNLDRSANRPQVLIIFDTSQSMEAMMNVPVAYSRTSGPMGRNQKVYYTLDASDELPDPKDPTNVQYFTNSANGCRKSWDFLKDYGMYTGFIRHYAFNGTTGIWAELPTEGIGKTLFTHTDCYEDIQEMDISNNDIAQKGFPADNLPATGSNRNPYTLLSDLSTEAEKANAQRIALETGFGLGKAVTLYTEDYLNWYHGEKATKNRKRLEIAKEVLTNVILTTPGVDFGLAAFNTNAASSLAHGARIVRRVETTDSTTKKGLIQTISNLQAKTSTPLCESLYEASLYFGGKAVDFGDNDLNAKPKSDSRAQVNGTYVSPIKDCQNRAYVILVTDGRPDNDEAADNFVIGNNGKDSFYQFPVTADKDDQEKSYLASLAHWLNNNDVNSSKPGTQSISTYAIGFSTESSAAEGLLKETASRGGGKYFAALDGVKLQQAFLQAFTDILEKSASFTAPSVASNNFNRIQTFESVYYAMFLPNRGPRWTGNLKKFKVTANGDVVDVNGQPVLDSDGSVSRSACSHWSSANDCKEGDGSNVGVGGALGKLKATGSSRKVVSDLAGGLKPLTRADASATAGGDANLAALLKVESNATQIDNAIKWINGVDVDDADRDSDRWEMRQDVMGDPLHSKPLAINFGTGLNPDIRVLVGTNHGMLHMFKDEGNSVSESWAFFPWEMLRNVKPLRDNVQTSGHSVYGIDGSPVAWIENSATTDTSGSPNSNTAKQRVWVFFGLRRGGNAYYGMDITDKDDPKLLWRIDASAKGMAQLGQSWSKPVVTFIPGYSSTPVLIFGAGYDTQKDGVAVGNDDSVGKGVFIVDAKTGALIHSFGPETSSTMTQMPGIKDSIPNEVAVLDSNNDGLTDRVYATDTGGNVWRMDIPTARPNDAKQPWTAFKFAQLGGDSVKTDRRFFAAPSVAQTAMNVTTEYTNDQSGGSQSKVTTTQLLPYDAVVVGSGLRPDPKDTQREDMFFTLQDRNVAVRSFDGKTDDTKPPAPLSVANLYDVTSSPPLTAREEILFGQKRGWFYKFGRSGEKAVSAGTIVKGRVFFTSYVPGESATAANQCLIEGKGYLYGFDLHRGIRAYQTDYLEMGESLPDTPQLVVPSLDAMYLIGIGKAADLMVKKPCDKNNEHCDGCPPGDEKCIAGGMRTDKVYYYAN